MIDTDKMLAVLDIAEGALRGALHDKEVSVNTQHGTFAPSDLLSYIEHLREAAGVPSECYLGPPVKVTDFAVEVTQS